MTRKLNVWNVVKYCSTNSLEKHIVALHRKCKMCNKQFDTKMEKEEHMKMHTTCSICDITFPYESKLKRHMLSVNK
jgi:hypothetical protein